MQFSRIVGHTEKKDLLIQSVKRGRIPHAQLFVGSSGWGGLSLALAYAQYVCCMDRGEADSCGSCSSCRKFETLTHPDVHFTFPFPREKGDLCREVLGAFREAVLTLPAFNIADWMQFLGSEKKQANIPIAELRDILKTLSFKPFESEFKVVIIWLPEYMGKEGNVLLKAIEEPSQNTLFLLVTENPERILGTIISRTQMVRISPITSDAIADFLSSSEGLDPNVAQQVAQVSQGSLRTAMQLVSESENPYFEMLRSWMGICVTRKIPQIVPWSEKVGALSRESLKGYFLYCLEIFRGILISSHDPSLNHWLGKERDFIYTFQQLNVPLFRMEQMIVAVEAAMMHVERNARASLILTDLSYTMVKNLRNP
jgi:DNA polymerase III subunit delta'